MNVLLKKENKMRRYLEINGEILGYELTQKQVKNLNLRVRSDGDVRVSAPFYVPCEEVDSFVRRQSEMILRAREKILQSAPDRDFFLGEGGLVPIFGRRRRICVQRGTSVGAELYEERLVLTVRDPESEEELRGVLRKELGYLAEKSLPVVCDAAKRRFRGYEIPKPYLRYRCMVGKWGSCCPAQQEITFNKFLVCVPPECIEYVVTHELAHFLICDHSPEFHRLMDELMPDWRLRKKRMEPYGYLLHRL
jgi:predicted metal-dependent hydrolase